MSGPKDIPVSDTDELTVDDGSWKDRSRILSEYRETNSPLSAMEIEQRRNPAGKKSSKARKNRRPFLKIDLVSKKFECGSAEPRP